MSYFLCVNELHSLKNLSHKFADFSERYISLFLLAILDNLFQIGSAELEYQILCGLSLVIFRVVNVEKLDNIVTASEAIEHLILSTDELTCLSGSLNCYSFFVSAVPSLEHITYINF